MLGTACPLLQYPWDCLLSEVGFAAGLLLPALQPLYTAAVAVPGTPLQPGVTCEPVQGSGGGLTLAAAAGPDWLAALVLRVLLVRVVLGMGKLTFSSGWADPENMLYLKRFMAWQPLPTPLAWWLHSVVPDAVWAGLHYATWVLAVPLPALYLSSDHATRCVAAPRRPASSSASRPRATMARSTS